MNIFIKKVLLMTVLGLVTLALPATSLAKADTNSKTEKEEEFINYKVSDEAMNTMVLGSTFKAQFPDPIMAQAVADSLSFGDVNEVITSQMIEATIGLDLSGRGIKDATGIGIFKNLRQLFLHTNNLTSLPDDLGELVELENLTVVENKISSLPDDINLLRNLSILVLTSNNLKSLPNNIGDLSNLFMLVLDYNELESLPDSIGNLENLQILILNDNNLKSLPESLGELQLLDTLVLYRNNFTKIPDSIGNLSSLMIFSISENNLIDVPEEKFNLLNTFLSLDFFDQSYSVIVDTGIINYRLKDFVFDALPAQEQFLNYDVTFTFELVKPDGSVVDIEPIIENGKITIDGAYLDSLGAYTLKTHGIGGIFEIVEYEQSFSIDEISKPIIDLLGEENIVLDVGDEFSDPGFIASDILDGDITSIVNISGEVNTDVPGDYILTYIVTNSEGESFSIDRKITVLEEKIEEIIDEELTTEGSEKEEKAESEIKELPKTGGYLEVVISCIYLLSGGVLLAKCLKPKNINK